MLPQDQAGSLGDKTSHGGGFRQQRSCELASAVHLIYLLGDGSGLRSISGWADDAAG
jgi:hypothetical protein